MRSIGLEIAASAGIYSVTTNDAGAPDGTAYVQLGDIECNQVVIYNDSGVVLRVRYCTSAGAAISGQDYLLIPDDIAQPLRGIGNANQVQIRRDDGSDTQVTVKFTAEGVAI